MFEALESRRVLSITWVNRGRNDGFAAAFTDAAEAARRVVDAAIADWSAAVPSARNRVRISVTDLGRSRNAADAAKLGDTSGSTIRLDDNAAGRRWYVDANPADDSDIIAADNPYAGNGRFGGSDLYSVAAHELGHALGFRDSTNPAVTTVGRRRVKDYNHTARTDDLMTPGIPPGTRRLIAPYDIARVRAGRRIANPTAPRSLFAATVSGSTVSWAGLPTGTAVSVYRATSPITDVASDGVTLLTSTTTNNFTETVAPAGAYYAVAVDATDPAVRGLIARVKA